MSKEDKNIGYLHLRKEYSLETIECNIPDPIETLFGTFMPKNQYKVNMNVLNIDECIDIGSK